LADGQIPVRRPSPPSGDGVFVVGLGRLLWHGTFARPVNQPFKVAAHLIKDQVGALRIVNKQVKQSFGGIDGETMSAIAEVEPGPAGPIGDEIDHLRTGQQANVVAHILPGDDLGQGCKMSGTVSDAFIDQFHGIRTITDAGDNRLSQ
jgi:hypothetical protein